MYKKTIKYVDFNENEREEDFYFNITKQEAIEMQFSVNGGMDKLVERIQASQDIKEIIKIFKQIICKSYGEKSLDGKYFYKEDENGNPLVRKFMATNAFSALYMELGTNADSAAKFIKGVLPKDDSTGPQDHLKSTN